MIINPHNVYVVLPGGMNGSELAREIRKSHPDIAVLLTSGYPDAVGNERSHLEEWPDMLPKPYLRADLVRRIRQVLDQAS